MNLGDHTHPMFKVQVVYRTVEWECTMEECMGGNEFSPV